MPGQSKGGDKIKLVDQDTGTPIKETATADFINNFFTNVGPRVRVTKHVHMTNITFKKMMIFICQFC